jgi:hypothetical protein
MKLTSIIKESEPVVVPPPTLESVTIKLTAREAFLLKQYLGPTNDCDMTKIVNNTIGANVSDIPKSLQVKANASELRGIGSELYSSLADALREAYKAGVK